MAPKYVLRHKPVLTAELARVSTVLLNQVSKQEPARGSQQIPGNAVREQDSSLATVFLTIQTCKNWEAEISIILSL